MSSSVVCPKCGATTDARAATCGGCGVDLLAAFEGRAWGRKSPAKSATAKRRGGRFAWLVLPGALAAGLGSAVFLRGLWVLKGPSSGRPLPERVFVDRANRFAFTPPSGWRLELLEEPSGSLRRAVRLTRGQTVVEVCVGEPSAADAPDAELLKRAFDGAELSLGTAEASRLDGLSARLLEASGGRAYLPSPEAGRKASDLHAPAPAYESVEPAALVLAARDASSAFVVRAISEKSRLAADRPEIERFLASFRVLDRPWRP